MPASVYTGIMVILDDSANSIYVDAKGHCHGKKCILYEVRLQLRAKPNKIYLNHTLTMLQLPCADIGGINYSKNVAIEHLKQSSLNAIWSLAECYVG